MERSRLLDEDDELSKPRCCLMLCILPWRPEKIYQYLLGKSEENSKKNKQLQLLQRQDYTSKLYNDKQMREPRQGYEQTFFNSKTSRYDYMQGVERDASDTESDENESLMENGYPYFVSVGKKKFKWEKSTNFFDRSSHRWLWMSNLRDKYPAILRHGFKPWMKYVPLTGDGFLLYIKGRGANNYFFLASIDEDNSVGIYKKDTIESAQAKYVWRHEVKVFGGERKSVLLSSDNKYLRVNDGEERPIKLTTQFELAASWKEDD